MYVDDCTKLLWLVLVLVLVIAATIIIASKIIDIEIDLKISEKLYRCCDGA